MKIIKKYNKMIKNEKNKVILCNKCYKNKVYFIPLFQRNKGTNYIEYKCSLCDSLKDEDIIEVNLDEKLLNLLKNCQCEKHENNLFCCWCNTCKKNLCFLCISDELKKNHKYELFMQMMPGTEKQKIYDEQINNLNSLLNDYNFYCPFMEKEINLLKILIKISEKAFNLYYIEKIQNYQTINNLLINFIDLQKNIDLLEEIFLKNQYIEFFSCILNKEKNKINQIIFNTKKTFKKTDEEELKKLKILPLYNDNNSYSYKKLNNKYFAIFYFKPKDLYIYDINGKIIKEIKLEQIKINNDIYYIDRSQIINKGLNNEFEIIQYDTNIILLFYSKIFYFIFFSSDYKNYEIVKYNIEIANIEKLIYDNYSSKMKLFKVNNSYICLLLFFNLYYINFDEEINLYKNLKENEVIPISKKKLNETLNKIDKEYIFDSIPIFSNDNDNNINIEIICLCFQKKIKNLNLGFNFWIDNNEEKTIYNECQIKIYTNDLKEKNSFKIYFKFGNIWDNLLYGLNYNYTNNMLLILIGENILQVSLTAEQIVTIYTIMPSVFKNTKNLEGPIKKQNNFILFSFHNYNAKTTKYNEIILLKDISEQEIYPYYWDDKSLLVKTDFKLPKFLNLIEFNPTEHDYLLTQKENEKILIDEEKIIIFS